MAVTGRLRSAVVRSAITRGVLGTSRFWLVVAVSIGIRSVVRRLTGGGPELLFSEPLRAGDKLVIRTVPRDS